MMDLKLVPKSLKDLGVLPLAMARDTGGESYFKLKRKSFPLVDAAALESKWFRFQQSEYEAGRTY